MADVMLFHLYSFFQRFLIKKRRFFPLSTT
ncbi:Uncharacterised protein [Legionella feeleii]|uniref:Uncharacterized protein n=1 Tax=Legionella feeleii TaxID=453 RepID=A0A378IZ83_9GAMM|nr:Uncharacterised protein [Legionella feeleii]